MASHTVKEQRTDSFPAFEGEPHYLEGYVPSSFSSPHSSLNHSVTWMGMGFILSSVVGIGTISFALGSHTAHVPGVATVGTQVHWEFFLYLGIAITLACWIIGGGLIRYGRRDYRAYRARTGRIH